MNNSTPLGSSDAVFLFCIENDCRSMQDIAQVFDVSRENIRAQLKRRGISFKHIKDMLLQTDFADSSWWDDDYVLEDGERVALYKEAYWVSNYGEVLRKVEKTIGGIPYSKLRALKTPPDKISGYPRVSIGGKNLYVHRLVALLWVRGEGSYVKFKNNNPQDVHYMNLKWVK